LRNRPDTHSPLTEKAHRACVLPGRFQPFHNGHAETMLHAAAQYQRIIVAISNAHISHTAGDPFTGGERFEMVREFARASALGDRVDVVPIAVDDEPTTWVSTIRAICPPFDDVYTRSPWTESLFAYWGIRNAPELATSELLATGTAVREAMADGADWKPLVPSSVADVLEAIDGPERMQLLLRGRNHRLTSPS
jgi:nicotinamide-nucleotide adenylyltransferase